METTIVRTREVFEINISDEFLGIDEGCHVVTDDEHLDLTGLPAIGSSHPAYPEAKLTVIRIVCPNPDLAGHLFAYMSYQR